MHHGRTLGEMGAQPHSIGVSDPYPGRNHVVDHARKLVHAVDGEMLTSPKPSAYPLESLDGAWTGRGPYDVRERMPSRLMPRPHQPMTE